MAIGDQYRQIQPDDRWIEDANGNIVGVQNPRAKFGSETRWLTEAAKNAVDSLVSGAGIPLPSPRVVKEFSDLLGVTITPTNATVVSSIDQSSPFGGPALKLEITWTVAGGRVEITPPSLNIPAFDDHVAWTVWLDDATRVGQVSSFLGTTGYAKYQQVNDIAFAGGAPYGGGRVVVGGPMRQSNMVDGGFVFGGDTLQDVKLRISAGNPLVPEGAGNATTTVWVRDCLIPARQRPIVVLSFDDGFDAWATVLKPALDKYGFKATFALNSDQIDKVGGITSANLLALIQGGHHIASHQAFNYRLQTLLGQGNGKQNGANSSAQAVDAYAADYHAGRRALEAAGADPQGFLYHPWVQGGLDTAGMTALYAAGVDLARTTSPYEPQVYGVPMWNSALCIRAIELGSSRTLASAIAQVEMARKYGGLAWFMGHNFGTPDSVTWAPVDIVGLVDYLGGLGAAVTVMTARQVRDMLAGMGMLRSRQNRPTKAPVQQIGRLIGANLNSTADQAIALLPGSWIVEGVYLTTVSTSLAASAAAGGVYTAAAKGGTAAVAAAQLYTAMTAATDVMACKVNARPTASGNLYLSLTTAHGSAATADVFVFGRPA